MVAVVVEVTTGVVGDMVEGGEGVMTASNVGSLVTGPENALQVVGEVVEEAVIILVVEVQTDMVAAAVIATQEVAVIVMVAVVVAVAATVAVIAAIGMEVLIATVVATAMGVQGGGPVGMVEVVALTDTAVGGHPGMIVAITVIDRVHMIAQMEVAVQMVVQQDRHMMIAIEHLCVVFGNCVFRAAAAPL
jgi:hypothetical protein